VNFLAFSITGLGSFATLDLSDLQHLRRAILATSRLASASSVFGLFGLLVFSGLRQAIPVKQDEKTNFNCHATRLFR
jgi:hypothetical protein